MPRRALARNHYTTITAVYASGGYTMAHRVEHFGWHYTSENRVARPQGGE